MNFNPQQLRQQYNPDGSPLRRMQMRMLEIMQVVDDICRRHNLPYWLSSGTLLGAVRHQGFIPWDDDLDIEMLRPDFERLMKLLPDELPPHLALQWHTTDPNYFFTYAKVRDRNSHMSEANGYDRVWKEQGIFIDIFPLERMPRWVHTFSNPIFGHAYKMLRTAPDPMAAMPRVRAWVWMCRNVVFPVLRAVAWLCRPKHYDFVLGIPYYKHSTKEDILPLRRVPFEHLQLPIMAQSEKCLTFWYGDFMQLPKNPGDRSHTTEVEIKDIR